MIRQTPADTLLRTVDLIVYGGCKALEAISSPAIFFDVAQRTG